MMNSLTLALGLSSFAHHVRAGGAWDWRRDATVTERAIVPTASGQIGVNPVSDVMGDSGQYVASIGVDTQYLTQDGTTTKWIGVNTELLTDLIETTTINDVPTTTTIPVAISVATASAAVDGLAAGDVTVVLSQALNDNIEAAVKAAAQTCAAAAKRLARREDFMACMIRLGGDAANGVGTNGAAFDTAAADAWNNFILEAAQAAPEILANAIAVLKSQAAKNKLAIFMAVVATMGITATNTGGGPAPPKLKFPGGKVGNTQPPSNTTPTPSSSSSSCNPSATPDENSPVCDDDDCQGKDLVCQAETDKKNCRCTGWAEVLEDTYDTTFGDDQQKILNEALSNLPSGAAPSCFRNTNGDNFAGEPRADPSAWCVCTSGRDSGIYATMTVSDSPCAYQAMPTETITISNKPAAGGDVTSCRWVTDTDITISSLQQYCTCNDDSMHGDQPTQTITSDGNTITTCGPTKTEATTTSVIPLANLGTPTCMGNPATDATFTKDEANKLIEKACSDNVNNGMKYPADGGWTPQFFNGYTYKNGKTSKDDYLLFVEIGVFQRACAAGQDFVIDFKAMGMDKCKAHLTKILDACPDLTGGINYEDCATWRLGTSQ